MRKTNRDYLKEVIKLMEENPEMEVKIFVDSYEVVDMSFTDHRITEVKICPWRMFENAGDGMIFIEEEEIVSAFVDYDGLTIEEAVEKYKEEVKPVILIYTGA
jgi:hypothetical protein